MKSPPELWAEVSDPAALARHLGEIAAEIRITRVEPERSVVWEGDGARGRVELAPSGWGTKVMLTLQAEDAGYDPDVSDSALPAPIIQAGTGPRGADEELAAEPSPPAGGAPVPVAEAIDAGAHAASQPPSASPAQLEGVAVAGPDALVQPREPGEPLEPREPGEREPGEPLEPREPVEAREAPGEPAEPREEPCEPDEHQPALDAGEAVVSTGLQAAEPGSAPEPRRGLLARLRDRLSRSSRAQPEPALSPMTDKPIEASALSAAPEPVRAYSGIGRPLSAPSSPSVAPPALFGAVASPDPGGESDPEPASQVAIESVPTPTSESRPVVESEPAPAVDSERASEPEPEFECKSETEFECKSETEFECKSETEFESEPNPPSIAGKADTTGPSESARSSDADGRRLSQQRAAAALTAMLDSLGAAHHRPFSRS